MVAAVLCASGSATPRAALSNLDDPTFLQDWFGNLAPVLENRTLLQLSLPGTHDTLTADLSSTVSDDANDMPSWLAWVLHLFGDYKGVGGWLRDQVRPPAHTMIVAILALQIALR